MIRKLFPEGVVCLFFYSVFESRPTMAIDFLPQNLSNDAEEMEKIINSTSQFSTKNEFTQLEIKTYHGVRLKCLKLFTHKSLAMSLDFEDVIYFIISFIEPMIRSIEKRKIDT